MSMKTHIYLLLSILQLQGCLIYSFVSLHLRPIQTSSAGRKAKSILMSIEKNGMISEQKEGVIKVGTFFCNECYDLFLEWDTHDTW